MKPTKTQKIRVCIIFYLILLFLGFLLGHYERKGNKLIEENGIKGVGLVTRFDYYERRSQRSVGSHYFVNYEYIVNGVTYYKTQSFYNYMDAIVGMKYRVKYLEEKPKKSIILLEQPIISEYQNIENVRDSLRATDNNKYERGLKEAEPIESVKARYPEYFH